MLRDFAIHKRQLTIEACQYRIEFLNISHLLYNARYSMLEYFPICCNSFFELFLCHFFLLQLEHTGLCGLNFPSRASHHSPTHMQHFKEWGSGDACARGGRGGTNVYPQTLKPNPSAVTSASLMSPPKATTSPQAVQV